MILITGSTGQLGQELVKLCQERGIAFRAVARPAFDFEQPESVAACFATAKPDLVINAAAYTAVDKAETDQDAARAGNHTGPLQLAQLCEAANIPFIHVSTDYVFDGAKGAPYVESDPTNPTGVYGTTKRDGEAAILNNTTAKAIILRTAWVYAAHGKNFARTMLGAARRFPTLRVVADQRGTPTAAPDLAQAILAIAARLQQTGWRPQYHGIFHATGSGETTWHGFATAIFAEAAASQKPPEVQPITTADWPTPARRPADSRLDCAKLTQVFGITLPPWRTSLGPIVQQLLTLDPPG
ncbi:NAD(P)-dependent oxidoreductase [Acidocella aquatica]|uniref:dTDP-4-dehydrorhamnose reductase n=1 Tax=Acidocella aquatica TaxID=1922313 RepID=A0ABQ6A9A0_9PROT|nr:dTDP-4-dehydrorhamnose reductase [Acidocella aquatica]GLR67935.1 NAD(P)-dependent oxidoreductase [Acidocella aquatica]